MRIARIPFLLGLLLATLLTSGAFTASMARAQDVDQTASRGQVAVDDIVDRMNEAERQVLARLRTYHPLMEVYIQNLAPDEARGWIPTDDNYFLGQLYFDETPTLRPIGQKKPVGLILRVLGSSGPDLANSFAAISMASTSERTRHCRRSSGGRCRSTRTAGVSTSCPACGCRRTCTRKKPI